MPTHIGSVYLPRRSPCLARARRAVRQAWQTPEAQAAHQGIVVGLSGGADSLALLAACCAEELPVEAVCIDHQLQQNSAHIAAQAAALAERMGASATVIPVEVSAESSPEAAARSARYEALFRHAAGREVWVAHTADDQAETLLLSLLRGHATAMAPRSGALVRPFLELRRADTQGVCTELGLTWWDDPHNSDSRFRRSAVRHQVTPLLSQLQGGDVVPALAQAARYIREDEQALQQLTHTCEAHCDHGESLDCRLGTEPASVRRRIIAGFLRRHGAHINASTLASVDALLTQWHGQKDVAVGQSANGLRLVVNRKNGRLWVNESQQ